MRVLHVLPIDVARGAQVYARALADTANRVPGEQHEVAVLFSGPRVAAFADYELGVPSGRLHAAGLDPRAAWLLWRLVRRTDPDVVLAHGAEAMKYAVLVRTARRRVACHAIGVVSPKALHGASRRLHTALVRRADLVTAVSGAVADQLQQLFGVRTVRVIPNGRDPCVYAAEPSPTSPPQLIYVGHLTRTKRPEVFVDVVSRLRARGCNFDAVMVGGGPMERDVAQAAGAVGIEMLGRRSDIPSLLQRASVFLFTSTSEGEGMPGVLIEAGLAGLPVVATDVPGVRDVVVDRDTGRVAGVDDTAALATAAEELLRDPSLRAVMGESARRRCTRLFSLEASTAMFVTELRALVQRPRPPRSDDALPDRTIS